MYMNSSSGKVIVEGRLPPNHYGDSTFLVKVQNSFNPAASMWTEPNSPSFFEGAFLVYDKAQSVMFHLYPQSCPEGHAALARKLRLEGLRGNNPAARKLYLRARREAAFLRVYVGALPEQRQAW
jgi:hypothetical protein